MSRLLVLAETNGGRILPATLSAVAFAQQYSKLSDMPFDLLLIGGPEIDGEVGNWTNYGADELLVVVDSALEHPTADQLAAISSAAMTHTGGDSLAAASTTFGRDVLPRAAALMGVPMVSDVLSIAKGSTGELIYQRPMYAGNVIATVTVDGGSAVFSVRSTSFTKPAVATHASARSSFTVPVIPAARAEWISINAAKQSRPELTTARVVVSGGRPLRDAATFERIIGGLADKLGGAVGATRAAVDGGIVPNELQVGQTGKVVAPELYIAAGISGSVQHLAGMKDSKVIVAINTDPEAPIFNSADYGLVADLFQAVPELTDSL
jgi:electron transfer flavoprotein alpha subunit